MTYGKSILRNRQVTS